MGKRQSSARYVSSAKPSSSYANEVQSRRRPVSQNVSQSSRNSSRNSIMANSASEYNSTVNKTSLLSSYKSKPTNVKTLMAKLTGLGHMIIPKDIKFQKRLISFLLYALFMFSSIVNGIIVYGIEKVISDKCYSPFSRVQKQDGWYMCPSFAGGFIKSDYAIWIRFFEIGSSIHTVSIGIGSSAVYYLNFTMILIYIFLFLIGLTLMLASTLLEILFVKAGLFVYFNLSAYYLVGFLFFFFIVDVILLFATINLEVRWINYLSN